MKDTTAKKTWRRSEEREEGQKATPKRLKERTNHEGKERDVIRRTKEKKNGKGGK